MKAWSLLGTCFVMALAASVATAKPEKKRKPASVERPPQFVLLAFDGSLNLDFWGESVAFADTVRTTGVNGQPTTVKFTYFINPPYYIEPKYAGVYKTPGLNKAVSCIGWSKPEGSAAARMRATNNAFRKGHEIGSHANSHCDASGTDRSNPLYGKRWQQNEWQSEFDQFNKMIFGAFAINRIPAEPILFKQSDIVGFRAPLLAFTEGLWPTLKKNNFRYDTSQQSPPTYWPQRDSRWGGWNFPLGRIKIAGTNRTTLSMDYNWLVYHSAGQTKPGLTEGERERFRLQMLESYKYYFKQNYFGGRAPVHIGHHFSKWNHGAYWDAMKDFTKFVCGLKEVRCVTYKDYADWLDNLPAAKYQAFRSGQFDRMRPDASTPQIRDISTPVLAEIRLDSGNNAYEAIVGSADIARVEAQQWQPQLQINFKPHSQTSITREELLRDQPQGATVFLRASLVNRQGVEVNWETYRIDNLGTPEEFMSLEPIENGSNKPETIEAHTIEE